VESKTTSRQDFWGLDRNKPVTRKFEKMGFWKKLKLAIRAFVEVFRFN
jgi:hypothetical protein